MVIPLDVSQIVFNLNYVGTEFFAQTLFFDPVEIVESIVRKLVNPFFR